MIFADYLSGIVAEILGNGGAGHDGVAAEHIHAVQAGATDRRGARLDLRRVAARIPVWAGLLPRCTEEEHIHGDRGGVALELGGTVAAVIAARDTGHHK